MAGIQYGIMWSAIPFFLHEELGYVSTEHTLKF